MTSEYWAFVRKAAREVSRWPKWKLGLTNVRETRRYVEGKGYPPLVRPLPSPPEPPPNSRVRKPF